MTERRSRRPGPALVIWSSIGLFAVLFAVLSYRLAASEPPPPRPVVERRVVKRRVITTVVPTPAPSSAPSVTGSAPVESESIPSEPPPVVTGAS